MAMLLITCICFAQTPGRPDWVTFTRTGPTTGTITWSAEPRLNVGYYYLGIYPTTNQFFPPAYCDPFWNAGSNWPWLLNPNPPNNPIEYSRNVTGLNPAVNYFAYVAAVETGTWSCRAYSSWESVPALPVVLSSFTATRTASSFVTLSWTTQSESNLIGYRLYRSENQSLTTAMEITPAPIPATNTSNTMNYRFEDHEVVSPNTYWYWLESVEINNHYETFGPASVVINENVVPPQTMVSSFGSFYPNPFRSGASINLNASVKADEQAVMTIHDLRGRVIKTYQLNAGTHALVWDGKDSNGNHCGSGIYFCRLSSTSSYQVKKLLMLK